MNATVHVLSLLEDVLSDAVLVCSPEGEVLYATPRWRSLSGHSLEELRAAGPGYRYWPAEDEPSSAIDGPVFEPTGLGHTHVVHRSGRRVPVWVQVALLEDCVVHVARPTDPSGKDISPREAALEEVVRRVSQELAAVGVDQAAPSPLGERLRPERIGLLSPREQQVIGLFLAGSDVAAIGQRLHLSTHTVRSHLKAIYRKFGVHSQAELLLSIAADGPD